MRTASIASKLSSQSHLTRGASDDIDKSLVAFHLHLTHSGVLYASSDEGGFRGCNALAVSRRVVRYRITRKERGGRFDKRGDRLSELLFWTQPSNRIRMLRWFWVRLHGLQLVQVLARACS